MSDSVYRQGMLMCGAVTLEVRARRLRAGRRLAVTHSIRAGQLRRLSEFGISWRLELLFTPVSEIPRLLIPMPMLRSGNVPVVIQHQHGLRSEVMVLRILLSHGETPRARLLLMHRVSHLSETISLWELVPQRVRLGQKCGAAIRVGHVVLQPVGRG